jgi:hypothetical protein
VCCITADPHRKSATRTPAPDAIYPTKSQPFSIIWEDNTDSVVDLRSLQQFARNFEQGLHKPSTSTATRLRPLPFASALDMQNIARARAPGQK